MMTRFVFTLLAGLTLSMGALVSSGPVLAKNWNTNDIDENTEKPNRINLAAYDEFRGVIFNIDGQNYDSHTAFKQGKNIFGFYAKGILFYEKEVCNWKTNITNRITKTGSFDVNCPSGLSVTGSYTSLGNRQGSYGSATDSRGRKVSFEVGVDGTSCRAAIENFYISAPNATEKTTYELCASSAAFAWLSDSKLCVSAVSAGVWETRPRYKWHVNEAKRRGLSCGVGESLISPEEKLISESLSPEAPPQSSGVDESGPENLFAPADNLASGQQKRSQVGNLGDYQLCNLATFWPSVGARVWDTCDYAGPYLTEVKKRGLSCGVWTAPPVCNVGGATQTASAPKAKPKVTPAALDAAEKEAERLRQELAAREAKKKQQQKKISNDTQVPLITITQSETDGRKGSFKGYAKDNVQVAEVLIDGQAVRVGNDGSFEWSGFVPATGKEITIEAIDTAALSSTKTVNLKRARIQQASGPRFDVLDPTAGKRVKRNDNALALIVGIADYERTDAPAVYADKDAQYFHDYASLKLGISDSNIKTMVNAKAEQGDVILAVKDWIRRSSKPGKTDVYVFFAGHGLASDNGEQMYLLPYDGRPRLLNKTAILRQELFDDIAAADPRSVTVFLDTCYSGTTRGTGMLISSRPVVIKAVKQSVPDNFTVLTAAAGDQTAKPLEEAKHGMFSYFLMKGMEGEADKNQDNKITAGELHAYVQQNVVQQSSGSQTPELQGDADRVLVRFQ